MKALLLSGIGPREELYEVGVQPKVDLRGVGKNLEDHLVGVLCTVLCIPYLRSTDGLRFLRG